MPASYDARFESARGEIKRVYRNDPSLAVLEERGFRHEAAYQAHLKQRGFEVWQHDEREGSGLQQTIDAMKSGVGVIVQAELQNGRLRGRADVLLRVNA